MTRKKAKTTSSKSASKSLVDFNQTPNSELFMEELRIMSSAAVGVILVRTKEFHRAVGSLFEFAVAKGDTNFHVWSVAEGWKELRSVSTNTVMSRTDADSLYSPSHADFAEGEPAMKDLPEEEFIYDLYPKDRLCPTP